MRAYAEQRGVPAYESRPVMLLVEGMAARRNAERLREVPHEGTLKLPRFGGRFGSNVHAASA